MPLRLKKIIGALAICVFLLLWITVAIAISGFIPRHWAAELAFYVVAGMGWGIPLLPLLSWMDRTKA